MRVVITIIVGYLMGSFSGAYFLGKIFQNIDIREYGSGNAGTTNVLRTMGKKMAILTFAIDILKGIAAIFVGRYIYGYNGELLASIAVVLGHNYPIFLGFKGGKGIATSFGVLMIINWKFALIIFGIFLLTVIVTKYVSLGSIMAAIAAPIVVCFVIKPFDINLLITVLILATMSIYMHRKNLVRLYKGEENRLGNKK